MVAIHGVVVGLQGVLHQPLDILINFDIIRNMDEKTVNPLLFAKALADDTRQKIMGYLCCEWLSVNDVVARLGGQVKQPTVSHHLKLLEEAQLVHVRQEGRQRFYSLNQERVTLCCGVLMTQFAPDHVEANTIDIDSIPVED